MQQAFRASALVPRGFVVDDATSDDAGALITVRSVARASACPGCGSPSERVHSRYRRRLADLPISGRPVRLMLLARRFHCNAVLCGRRVFAERFDADVLAPWARRTARLDRIVHHLGLALGGRPAASFARRLMVPASRDTLLRAVRRRGSPRFAPPAVVGIDDWAWRRNRRYGTLIRGLERRRTIALLPDREPATAEAWLSEQPQIAVVARDRGGGYALAAARALPEATQVADRWHLMENASRAFLDAVRKSMRQIRAAIGAATIDPTLLTAAERIQYQGYLRREEDNAAILGLARDGAAIKEIVRRTGHSRGLVRKVLRGQRSDIFRVRESSLELHLPWLDAQWAAGERNGAALWRRLKRHGFRGCLRVVTEWATRRRQADRADNAPSRAPRHGPSRGCWPSAATGCPGPRPSRSRPSRAACRCWSRRGRSSPRSRPWCARDPWTRSNRGWSGRDPALSRPSPTACSRTSRQSPPRSPRPGRTARPRDRSRR